MMVESGALRDCSSQAASEDCSGSNNTSADSCSDFPHLVWLISFYLKLHFSSVTHSHSSSKEKGFFFPDQAKRIWAVQPHQIIPFRCSFWIMQISMVCTVLVCCSLSVLIGMVCCCVLNEPGPLQISLSCCCGRWRLAAHHDSAVCSPLACILVTHERASQKYWISNGPLLTCLLQLKAIQGSCALWEKSRIAFVFQFGWR